MLFLYLDESGDLGFDFVNKRPSSFFVVCILEIEGQDEHKRLSKTVKLVLRRKSLKHKPLRELKGKIDPAVPLNISHLDSHASYCLQVVDLFCWGLFRKYEAKDTAWYEVFKDKIKYENLAVL